MSISKLILGSLNVYVCMLVCMCLCVYLCVCVCLLIILYRTSLSINDNTNRLFVAAAKAPNLTTQIVYENLHNYNI